MAALWRHGGGVLTRNRLMTSVASSRMRVAVVLTLCIVVTASPRSRIVRSMCFAGSHQPCSSAYCTSSALEASGP